jgi:acetyltransferase-like isoleucine patch superfamily enzyme
MVMSRADQWRTPLVRTIRFARSLRNRLTLVLLKSKGCVIDWSAIVHPSAVFERSGGTITIGARTHIDRGAIIRAMGGVIDIGSDCSVNAYSFLSGAGGLHIANNVMIASHVSIYASSHVFVDTSVTMNQQGLFLERIDIERDVWVGTGVRILDGVRVATGSILAAGAVITNSTQPYSINGGVPSRQIGTRGTGKSFEKSAGAVAATRAGVSGD